MNPRSIPVCRKMMIALFSQTLPLADGLYAKMFAGLDNGSRKGAGLFCCCIPVGSVPCLLMLPSVIGSLMRSAGSLIVGIMLFLPLSVSCVCAAEPTGLHRGFCCVELGWVGANLLCPCLKGTSEWLLETVTLPRRVFLVVFCPPPLRRLDCLRGCCG